MYDTDCRSGGRRLALRSVAVYTLLAVVMVVSGTSVVADETTSDAGISIAAEEGTPAAVDEPKTPVAVEVAPSDSDEAAPGVVERAVTDYVQEVLRAAVTDVEGNVATCLCAVAVSVSLDGPANAVAALGRSSSTQAVGGPASGTARSGRSGDATAVSITGGGSASSSAVSGSTGSVGGGNRSGDVELSAQAVVRERSTTIDAAAITSSLRTLVGVLADEMGAAADADTSAHEDGLLSGVRRRVGSPSEVSVEVASWDGSSDPTPETIRCPARDSMSSAPRCGLAVSVTAGGSARAAVLPPPTASSSAGDISSVGDPGMAMSISVAVSGSAVSSARTGDVGARAPRGAPVEAGAAWSSASTRSSSFAGSGDSGSSTAVALTVRGASATSARSGDTGSALSSVVPAGAASVSTSSGVRPGDGGSAASSARSGGSGRSVALSNGVSSAVGDSSSGDTGDANALAADGTVGRDWSEPGSVESPGVLGGRGGDGAASAVSGRTGDTFSLVISGGSAVATSVSGATGSSTAASTGGSGGDTHASGTGTDVVTTGDGGSATADGLTGDTGSSTSVVVAPYDGASASRSGRSGGVRSSASGGNAGCASSGVDADAACRIVESAPPVQQPESAAPQEAVGELPVGAGQTAGPPDSGGQPTFASADTADPADQADPARPADPGVAEDSVRVEARSAGSADVDCSVTATHRTCRSADTPSTSPKSSRPSEGPGRHDKPTPATGQPDTGADVVLTAGRADDTVDTVDPLDPLTTPAGSTEAAGTSTIALLVNAAVPVLALLSLLATFLTRRRRQAVPIPQQAGKHRRKQSLPAPSSRHL